MCMNLHKKSTIIFSFRSNEQTLTHTHRNWSLYLFRPTQIVFSKHKTLMRSDPFYFGCVFSLSFWINFSTDSFSFLRMNHPFTSIVRIPTIDTHKPERDRKIVDSEPVQLYAGKVVKDWLRNEWARNGEECKMKFKMNL